MKQNPYLTTAIAYDQYFFGRQNQLESLYERILGSERAGSCSIVGEVAIGKASLIEEFCRRNQDNIKARYIMVKLNISSDFASGDIKTFYVQFLSKVQEQLLDEINTPSELINQADEVLAQESLPWSQLLGKIKRFFAALKQKGIALLIIFEHFDYLVDGFVQDPQFLTVLRHLADQPKYDVTYLISSRMTIAKIEEAAGITSKFAGLFGFGGLNVGLLSKKEAYGLIVTSAKRGGITWRPTEVQALIEVSGGHPYILQNLCHRFYREKLAGKKMTKAKFIQAGQAVFKTFFDTLKRCLTNRNLLRTLRDVAQGNREVHKEKIDQLKALGYLNEDYQIFSTLFASYLGLSMDLHDESPKPVYMKKLTVKNILCFRELTLEFTKSGVLAPLIVILGENNVGKTLLLQCLAGFDEQITCTELEDQGTFREVPLGYQERWGSRGIWADMVEGQIGEIPSTKAPSNFKINVTDEEDWIRLDRAFEGTKPPVFGYGAQRRRKEIALTEGQVLSTESTPTHTLFSGDLALPFAVEWLVKLRLKWLEEGGDPEGEPGAFGYLRTMLTNLVPGLQQPVFEVKGTTVHFVTAFGKLPIDALSTGYSTMITVMLDLARRLYQLNQENPLEQPAIVLIDEIDLHLHPTWQRSIITRLRQVFPNVQFIVTSHSPLVVQADTQAKVVLLEKENDQVVMKEDDQAVAGWRVDQILTCLMGLSSAYHPIVEEKLARRTELLTQEPMTPEGSKEVTRIERELYEMGMTDLVPHEGIQASELLERALLELSGHTRKGSHDQD